MIKVYSNRKIQLKTVETATERLLVAIVVDTYGSQTLVSEAHVIKIIKKKKGFVYLENIRKIDKKKNNKIASPYYQTNFSYKNHDILEQFFARPPTR